MPLPPLSETSPWDLVKTIQGSSHIADFLGLGDVRPDTTWDEIELKEAIESLFEPSELYHLDELEFPAEYLFARLGAAPHITLHATGICAFDLTPHNYNVDLERLHVVFFDLGPIAQRPLRPSFMLRPLAEIKPFLGGDSFHAFVSAYLRGALTRLDVLVPDYSSRFVNALGGTALSMTRKAEPAFELDSALARAGLRLRSSEDCIALQGGEDELGSTDVACLASITALLLLNVHDGGIDDVLRRLANRY